jgi:hypothetical protein
MRTPLAVWIAAAVAACSVDTLVFTLPPVTIGGTVTGLHGAELVLTNNGGDDLVISGDGAFTFKTPVERGTGYALAVKRQPANPTQVCTITNGNGTAGDEDVLDVQVRCSTSTFRIGGTVTGLNGSGLVLQNNGSDSLMVAANGAFTFATAVPSGATYDVTVAMQPAMRTQECTVTPGTGTGTVGDSDVTSVAITCVTRSFTIGGTVTGLVGAGLVLQNNGGDDLAITANGSFTFTTPVLSGDPFAVTVRSQPTDPWQTCTVGGGTGTVGGGDVTSVAINCTTNRYMITGTISGLVGTVTLQNNGGDDLNVTANGSFAFATPVTSGQPYAVTVAVNPRSPIAQTCTVAPGTGSGTVTDADVTSVVVTCTTNRYPIGGTLTGLGAGNSITLQNNGGDDLTLSADGDFKFLTPVLSGQPYAVTLIADPTSPISQTCTVTSGDGIVGDSDVTSVVVTCTTNDFTIGGTVTGLAGTGLVLQNSGGDDLAIAADGSFTFATPVPSGAAFAVTVRTHPTGLSQTCTVAGGTGTVGAGDVTSVAVSCTTNRYTVGGRVTGLAGTGLVLQSNGGDNLAITADGTFTFATSILSGETYAVTVLAQPTAPSQTCTVTAGAGTVTSADITSVAIDCTTNRYTIGGTLSGLAPGNSLRLRNNGGDDLLLSGGGGFTFLTPVASGQPYDVTVVTNPTAPISQTCTVTSGAGVVGAANVTNVAVTCTTNRYLIGGTLTGLAPGNSLRIRNNGADEQVLTANGSFVFAAPVASGQTYAVIIVANPTAPVAQTCTVTNGTGTVGSSNITNIQITCTTNRYTIGGTLTGLAPGNSVRLRNNGGDELVLTASVSFTFATPVDSGQAYAVTVAANPTSPIAQTCTVTNGAGIVGSSNVTNVAVTCTTNRYTIGGTLTGLAPGDSLTLLKNGGDDLTVSANGSFTFATPVVSGQPYSVTVFGHPTSPVAQTCTVTAGAGTVTNANVTTVVVTCTTNRYTIGGTLSGLAAGNSIRIRNNGADDLVLSGGGGFTFVTPVDSGQGYAVTVAANPTSPISQTCTVTNGTGTVGAANITNVQVTCTTNRFTIGGTVIGLSGTGLVLQSNGGDNLAISANGSFTFATPVASGQSYAVTVFANPTAPIAQTCTVTNGTGIVGAANVTNVAVTCTTNRYTIGGTVSGLAGTVVLHNNGGDTLAVSANGSFTFATSVLSGQPYAVTVFGHPASPIEQTCTVTNGTGMVGSSNITNVQVTCTANRYSIGGTLSGLASGNAITLRNNGGDDLVLSANGGFTFAATVASGQPYTVTVVANPTSPVAQTCTVTNGTGTVSSGNITNVVVTCTTNRYRVGGTLGGLVGTVTLRNNGGDDLILTANGTFTFATTVASGAPYNVTVRTQPSGQACVVSGGTGTVGAGDVTTVQVTCRREWDLSLFPVPVPGSTWGLGDLALDGNGDLLVVAANPTPAIVRVDRATGAQTTVASGVGTNVLVGITYRAANDMIYATNLNSEIFAVTSTGSSSLLTTVGLGFLNAITIAPPSFGSFGGFIIGVTQSGAVVAVDPSNGTVSTITATAGAASDLTFAPDGTLYICGGSTVRTVTAAGTVAPFASGLSSADGITITPDGARMFIADGNLDVVFHVTIPGAVVTSFVGADIDSGFGVGGIVATQAGTLIVMTGESNLTLQGFAY